MKNCAGKALDNIDNISNNNLADENNLVDNEVSKYDSDDYIFPLNTNDTVFVLTINNSNFKENVGNIVSKMIVFKELKHVSLNSFSQKLGFMGIEKLNIFSIDNKSNLTSNDLVYRNKGCLTKYLEVKHDDFVKLINQENRCFKDYNKDSLYIIRGGNYIDIKNIFNSIDNVEINLGRGGSQKSHILSPLDFRLSSYIMAMAGFNFNLVNNINTFNYISKDRYLTWLDKSCFLSNKNKSKYFINQTNKKLDENKKIL